MLRWTDAETGSSMINIINSINIHAQKIYQTDLVLASYSGKTASLNTLDEIAEEIRKTQAATKELAGHPGEYIRGILRGLYCIARVMQGDDIPYQQQIADMQQVQSKEIPQKLFDKLEEDINRELSNLGYKGKASSQIRQWLSDTKIKPQDVVNTCHEFLRKGKKATLERIVTLPQEDEIESINGIRDVCWSGNSKYLGGFKGELTFNLDRPWSTPTFANILCHEGYPGHQAFYCHWDDLYLKDLLPLEGSFYVKNTPTNLVFEGAPESALHFIGWDDMDEDTPEVSDKDKAVYRLGRQVLDLQRMIQSNGCHYTNVSGMPQQEVMDYMTASGLFEEIEAENTYRFFTDPTRRTYYPSYYYGRHLIELSYKKISKAQRKDYFANLYNTPHTTDTFIKSIADMTGESFNPFDEM